MSRRVLPLGLVLLAACSKTPPSSPDASPEQAPSAPSAVTWSPRASSSAAASVAPASAPPASPAASAPAPEPAASAAASAAPASSASAPVPKVKVTNIGMHIGGGPDANEDANKEPIRKSVEPHFDAFRRCWALLDDPTAKGDFGVDLLIPRDGGKPQKVDNVRSALKGKPFRDCVVSTFEAIDFRKPRTGLTKVSYSLRFAPLRRLQAR